ncbi:hypothetical protein [Brevundimonas sp.]|uniref:hypothetical protein n=1 Tax=Brevundimonas sp. TaxID=1871086 RepID=UPI003562DFF8
MKNTLKAALLVSSALIAAPALAQTPLKAPPPQFYSTDANGVDLVNGAFRWSITPVQIGDANGGLAYSRTYFNSSYRDNVTGTLTFTGGVYYISIGGSTDSFTRSGSTFTPVRNVGQTLVQSETDLTYTTADGTTAIFSTNLADQSLPLPQTDGNIARITSIRQPNGEVQRFTYEVVYKEIQTDPNFWAARIRRVENNYGYALQFTYIDDFENASYSQIDNWRKLQKVTAFNLAECPDLSSCSTGTVWPSATFSGADITDQSGQPSSTARPGSESWRFAIRPTPRSMRLWSPLVPAPHVSAPSPTPAEPGPTPSPTAVAHARRRSRIPTPGLPSRPPAWARAC